jgi:hypothetical protein
VVGRFPDQSSDQLKNEEIIMGFVRFMSSGTGRTVRVIAGIALFGVGAWFGGGWWLLAAVGLVPLSAGILDVCLFAPLFGQPFSGRTIRRR